MVEENAKVISKEISELLNEINYIEFEGFAKKLLQYKKVFAAGAGRSGNIIECFAKRLMHADVSAYVVGETVTPPIGKDDVLIIASGSGETESLLIMAKKAKNIGARISLFTTTEHSSIARIAQDILLIPTTSPKSKGKINKMSIQPMANLYEQTLFIILDALSMDVARLKGMSDEDMFARHANIE